MNLRAQVVARAFALGTPAGELVHVRRGDTDTWRLETTSGSYLVKRYRQITAAGPVLVDWDSVRVDSAALEVGRVAHTFGAGESEPVRRIVNAYTAAGGDLSWAGDDLLFSVIRHDLQGLRERILVLLDLQPPVHWMGDREAIEQAVGGLLRGLPGRVSVLDQLV